MTFTLRPYQQEACDLAIEFFKNPKEKHKPIIYAPTAAGKSLYIGYIGSHMRHFGGVLVLQHSIELLEQNFAKFEACGGSGNIYSAGLNQKEIGHTTFATIGSVKSKASDFQHIKYVLIDECHLVPPSEKRARKKSMYIELLEALPDVKVLGLTATPFRMKRYNFPEPHSKINLLTRESPRFFNKFLHLTQIKELYEMGYLSPLSYYQTIWNNQRLVMNKAGSEFTDESIDYSVKVQNIMAKLPGVIETAIRKGRKHIIVFVRNIADAEQLACVVPNSACIHSKLNKQDRKRILHDFKSGKITTIFNVSVLAIGFDFPQIDVVILARPTLSMALYIQMVGRGVRIHEQKENCVLVDLCGNVERFGNFEDIELVIDGKGVAYMQSNGKILTGVKM